MNRTLGSICALSLVAVGCYASHQRPPDAGDAGFDAPPDAPDASPPDAPPPVEPLPGTCRQSCTVAADCGDRALRTCREGACYFVGCDSDADCPPTSGCAIEQRQCRQRCETHTDCEERGSDGGEVACVDGLCLLIGCRSDHWCDDYAERWGLDGLWRCAARPATATPRCWRVCEGDADCATAPGDHPRECVGNFCLLADCTDADECRSWYRDDWICVPR